MCCGIQIKTKRFKGTAEGAKQKNARNGNRNTQRKGQDNSCFYLLKPLSSLRLCGEKHFRSFYAIMQERPLLTGAY